MKPHGDRKRWLRTKGLPLPPPTRAGAFFPPLLRFSRSVSNAPSLSGSGRSARFQPGQPGFTGCSRPCAHPLGAFRGCVVVVTERFINLIAHFYGIFRHSRPVFVLFNSKRRSTFEQYSVLNAMVRSACIIYKGYSTWLNL